MPLLNDPTTMQALSDILGGVAAGASAYETPYRRRRILAPYAGLLAGGADLLGHLTTQRQNASQIKALGQLSGRSDEEINQLIQAGVTPEQATPLFSEMRKQQAEQQSLEGQGLNARALYQVSKSMETGDPDLTPEAKASLQPRMAELAAYYQQKPADTPGMKEALELPDKPQKQGAIAFDRPTDAMLRRQGVNPFTLRSTLDAGGPEAEKASQKLGAAQAAVDQRLAQAAKQRTTAEREAVVGSLGGMPYGKVTSGLVPFKADGSQLSASMPFGDVQKQKAFEVRSADMPRFTALVKLPVDGKQLIARAQDLWGSASGGLPAVARKAGAYLHGDPAYQAYQSTLSAYEEGLQLGLGKSNRESLLKRYESGINPETGNAAGVAAAVNEINQIAARHAEELKQYGQAEANRKYLANVDAGTPAPTEPATEPSDGGDGGDGDEQPPEGSYTSP